MANRGGKRAGVGRTKGTHNKRVTTANSTAQTRAILRKHSPLDIMIVTMNGFVAAAEILGSQIIEVNERVITQLGLLQQAAAIAKDAAPFIHPRLAAVKPSEKEGASPRAEHAVIVKFIDPDGTPSSLPSSLKAPSPYSST